MKYKIKLKLKIHKKIILYKLIYIYRYISLYFLLILLYIYLRIYIQYTFNNTLSKIPTSYNLYTNFFNLLRNIITKFNNKKTTTTKIYN